MKGKTKLPPISPTNWEKAMAKTFFCQTSSFKKGALRGERLYGFQTLLTRQSGPAAVPRALVLRFECYGRRGQHALQYELANLVAGCQVEDQRPTFFSSS